MDQLLNPIQTRSKRESSANLIEASPQLQPTEKKNPRTNSPEEVLEALGSKPDLKLLSAALQWLFDSRNRTGGFNIRKPGPKAAQIVFVLVNDILPNYWQALDGEETPSHCKPRKHLIVCLRSVAGIGAIISQIRLFCSQLKDPQSQANVPTAQRSRPLSDTLSVLENLLVGDDCVISIWKIIHRCLEQPFQKSLQWKEIFSLIASGKLLAIASEACLVNRECSSDVDYDSWIGNGTLYAAWLGRNIQHMNQNIALDDVGGRKSLSQLCSKALNLGYQGEYADDPQVPQI